MTDKDYYIIVANKIAHTMDDISALTPPDGSYDIEQKSYLAALDLIYSDCVNRLLLRYGVTRDELTNLVHCPEY